MQEHDLSWVRTEMTLAQAAPRDQVGLGAWLRKNLFATPVDSVLTVIALLAVAWLCGTGRLTGNPSPETLV